MSDILTVAYYLGMVAYHEGAEITDNPYENNQDFMDWSDGFTDAGENDNPVFYDNTVPRET